MSNTVAKVIEISSSSTKGIEDAVQGGLKKVSRSVKNIRGAWLNDIKVVTDGDGVQVSAAPDFRGGNFDPQQFRLRGLIQDLTDADGHFELVGLAAGSYSVRASRSAAGRGRMFGPDGETAQTGTRDLKIVLPADGGVKGKVAFADGTAPVGFGVSVGFAQDQPGGKDGAFELGDLPPSMIVSALRRTDRSSSTNTSMPPLTRRRPGRSVQNLCSYHVTSKSAPQSAANNSAAMAGSRPETSSTITVATRWRDDRFMAGSSRPW